MRIPYDNHMESAVTAVTTTLTAHPEAKRWIFYSCNDDGVLGGVRATESRDWRQPTSWASASTAAAHATPWRRQADRLPRHDVHQLGERRRAGDRPSVASLKDNSPLPTTTYVKADFITLDSFGSYKDKLCHK